MQISSAYHYSALIGHAQGQSTLRTAPSTRSAGGLGLPDAARARNTGPVTAANAVSPVTPRREAAALSATERPESSAASRAIRDIFGKYDLSAISSEDIDQLTADLKAARFDDLGFVMGLEREGAAYRRDMEASGRVYGIGDTEFDADAPIDLIEKTRADLTLAQRYGEDTDRLSAQLAKLEDAQTMRSPQLLPPPTPKLTETLVLFQAQRLWIEQEP